MTKHANGAAHDATRLQLSGSISPQAHRTSTPTCSSGVILHHLVYICLRISCALQHYFLLATLFQTKTHCFIRSNLYGAFIHSSPLSAFLTQPDSFILTAQLCETAISCSRHATHNHRALSCLRHERAQFYPHCGLHCLMCPKGGNYTCLPR